MSGDSGMIQGFTDIHHHLVYGVDDGAQTFDQAVEMAAAAWQDGTATLLCTSHISPGIKPFDTERYFRHLEKIQQACRQQGMGLRLLQGAEILYTEPTCRFLREKRIPTLGGTDYVLVEFFPLVEYREICEAVTGIQRAGYRPIIAHVERYRCLAASIPKLREVRDDLGAVIQMNCSTVIGGKGLLNDHRNRKLLDEGLIDVIGTDAHNTSSRPTQMRAAYNWLEKKYGGSYAAELMGLNAEVGIAQAFRSSEE